MIKLTAKELVKFENDYFARPTKYPYQRYGQALVNNFTVEEKYKGEFDKLFYEEDMSYSREMAWMIANGTMEI